MGLPLDLINKKEPVPPKALSLCSLSPVRYFTDKAESRVCLSLQLWFQPSPVPAGLGKEGGKQGERETDSAPTHSA